MNVCFYPRLDAQTSAVNSGKESYVQTLFDRLQEVHHEVMSDIVVAKGQCVLISCPIAFHQFRLESLLLKKTLLVRGVYRGFASQTDVTDPDFV